MGSSLIRRHFVRRLFPLLVVALALGVAVPGALAKPHADVPKRIADNGPIPPGAGYQPKRLHADAVRVAVGKIGPPVPWTTMRIYYARTPAMTLRWSEYVDDTARELISELDFGRYGVLAVLTPNLGCLPTNFNVDPVYVGPRPNALTAVVTLWAPWQGDHSALCAAQRTAVYALLKIRKSSLPYRVGRL